MHSCIFRMKFRLNEIFCMNIRRNLYETGEKWGKHRKCGGLGKFYIKLERANLWKRLWNVCITFCINGAGKGMEEMEFGENGTFPGNILFLPVKWMRFSVKTESVLDKLFHNGTIGAYRKGGTVMLDILSRAGSFIAIIVLGYVLKRIGVFKQEDFGILSKITIRITLPAAIITSFAGKEIDLALLSLLFLGIGFGALYILAGYLVNIRRGRSQQAFDMLNLPGYNIGCFTMPFAQSFLGPVGVITTSLFDSGNALVCLGGAYGVAASVKDGKGFDLMRILKAVTRSVPFVTYVLMVAMNLLHIAVPAPVVQCAGIIGGANSFMAMFMIGVGFKLGGDWRQIGTIVRVLGIRFGLAAVLALGCYFLLPFDLEVRQTLVILVFSPIGTAVPAFTAELGEDAGLSSAINSISIVISICVYVVLLSVML